jgi:hypothetical protein
MNTLIIINDLTPNDLMKLSKNAASQYSKVSLLYVKPTLPSCYYLLPGIVEIEEQTKDEAEKALRFVGNILHVKKEDQWSSTGRIKSQASYLAERLDADVILATERVCHDFHCRQLKLKHITCVIHAIQDVVEIVQRKKIEPFILMGHATA